MLDIAPSELLLVAVIALVVIGPKDLPRAMRVVGRWVGRARGVARHFRSGFDEMVRQAEMEEMEKAWAKENARIMAEHSPVPPEEADDVYHAATAYPAIPAPHLTGDDDRPKGDAPTPAPAPAPPLAQPGESPARS